MILNIVLLLIGFVLLIKGADVLVEGSSVIAKKFGISNVVIGLTVIAFGTSMPELIVNIIASIQGNSDIGMGNVVGSNIANILLILGLAALFSTLKVNSSIIKKEIPFSILASVALFILINSSIINGAGKDGLMRSGGLILILFFCIFLYYIFSVAKKGDVLEKEGTKIKDISQPLSIVMIIGGIVALFFGGKFIVDGAVVIASSLGLSQALIGLTIVAVGTSLPELAASVVAARKNQADMAIGNVVGSNIFNILWILGISAVINPLNYNPAMNFDILFLVFVSVMIFPLIFLGRKYHFTKKEGFILIGLYVAYLVYIIIRG
jgi:cation:H+ antiporter